MSKRVLQTLDTSCACPTRSSSASGVNIPGAASPVEKLQEWQILLPRSLCVRLLIPGTSMALGVLEALRLPVLQRTGGGRRIPAATVRMSILQAV